MRGLFRKDRKKDKAGDSGGESGGVMSGSDVADNDTVGDRE